ncbi:PREDICTED: uncharacterized protein LOC101306779 [Fragaria vesca subsp. vesca]|uniref:uncharacterized protein LOC101306779 n=1 Tax=Fragaria vesca subsp. vesca TaxID=101020 RepID=UPI0002C30A6C|nr:PREDICTED: uncharacterized protein LOC101306779 [Fragaria vesca subsp. vesca]
MVSIHFSNSLIALKPPHHLHPPYLSALKPSSFLPNKFPNPTKTTKYTTFRAELPHDAPFAAAIGACMLSSLVLPPVSSPSDDPDAGSGIDSTDARFAVMGVVSFIPYFNWLSWVFAWLDTGKRRYAVYALVYLTPYIRSNLSLSPEESWLPIASIIFCIIHVQIEASIKNGDLQGFQFFNEAAKHVSSMTKKGDHIDGHQGASKKGRERENKNLRFGQEQARNEIDGRGVPKRPLQDSDLKEDRDDNERRKQ